MRRKDKASTQRPVATPQRIIGLDNHPDSFTAGFLIGNDAQAAKVLKVEDHLPQERFEWWLKEHTTEQDIIVMEASANSFAAVEAATASGRTAVVLESQQCAKLGDSYCVTDRISAIKLARLYISRLPKKVWVPDPVTRLRREVFYAYLQATTDSTRARQRIRGFLNQYRIRLPKGFQITAQSALDKLLVLRAWQPSQSLLLRQYHGALREARMRREQLREVMAKEILSDPAILRLIRLCGLRHIVAFALVAFIGDITRFANPKKLAAYIGVNPSVNTSGNGAGPTSLKHHGCAPLRTLLIQAAQVILRTPNAAFAKWGYSLILRRGRNRAVVGVARKLATAVWYCLCGQFTALEEVPANIAAKLDLLLKALGSLAASVLGEESLSDYRERMLLSLTKSHALVFKATA